MIVHSGKRAHTPFLVGARFSPTRVAGPGGRGAALPPPLLMAEPGARCGAAAWAFERPATVRIQATLRMRTSASKISMEPCRFTARRAPFLRADRSIARDGDPKGTLPLECAPPQYHDHITQPAGTPPHSTTPVFAGRLTAQLLGLFAITKTEGSGSTEATLITTALTLGVRPERTEDIVWKNRSFLTRCITAAAGARLPTKTKMPRARSERACAKERRKTSGGSTRAHVSDSRRPLLERSTASGARKNRASPTA